MYDACYMYAWGPELASRPEVLICACNPGSRREIKNRRIPGFHWLTRLATWGVPG